MAKSATTHTAASAAALFSNTTNHSVRVSEAIKRAIYAGLVVYLEGSPGCGKSSIVSQAADDLNLKLIDIRLSTMDSTDLSGLPNFTPVYDKNGKELGKRTEFMPSKLFPLQGMDDLPLNEQGVPYDGWLILFDEITSAVPSVQAAAYRVILDRMIGEHHLHQNVAMVAAGNKESDNAVVYPMSTALRNRMVHIAHNIRKDDWVEWAMSSGIDTRIISYVRWKPASIESFDADTVGNNFSSARTFEFTNRILEESAGVIDPVTKMLIKGALGDGVGEEFIAFCNYYTEIPDIKDIIANPLTAPLPDKLGHQFAIAGVVAAAMDKANCTALIQYAGRMDKEFQVVMASDIAKRNPALLGQPALLNWINTNAGLFTNR